jgi:hypothetical protein
MAKDYASDSAEVTGLNHIQDNQIDERALQTFCNSVTIGPVKIEYCVDLTVPEITVKVYLAGILIGSGTINPSNPSITIGGSALGFKAEVTLTADFSKRQVTYKIEVCAPIVGCKAYSGVLFSW